MAAEKQGHMFLLLLRGIVQKRYNVHAPPRASGTNFILVRIHPTINQERLIGQTVSA